MDPLLPLFGEMLDEVLDRLDLNQVQMAEEFGITQQSISLWKQKGYIPLTKIDRVKRYIRERHEEYLFNVKSGNLAGGLADGDAEKLAQLIEIFLEMLDDMREQMLKNKNKGIAAIKAHATVSVNAEVKRMKDFLETGSKDQFEKSIKELRDHLNKQRESIENLKNGNGLFDKANAMSYLQGEVKKLPEPSGTGHFDNTGAHLNWEKQEKIRRLDRMRRQALLETKRLDREMTYILMKQLPGQVETRVEVNGRPRRVDYLSNEGAAVELTNAPVGRVQVDWRPIMTRIFEMAVLVKSPDAPQIREGHVIVLVHEDDLEIQSQDQVFKRLEFLVEDAHLMGVQLHLVLGEAPDIFATIVEKVLRREYDPSEWHIPMTEDEDYPGE